MSFDINKLNKYSSKELDGFLKDMEVPNRSKATTKDKKIELLKEFIANPPESKSSRGKKKKESESERKSEREKEEKKAEKEKKKEEKKSEKDKPVDELEELNKAIGELNIGQEPVEEFASAAAAVYQEDQPQQSRRGRQFESESEPSSRRVGLGLGLGLGEEESVRSESLPSESSRSVVEPSEDEGDEPSEEVSIRTVSSKDEKLKSKYFYLTKQQREEMKKGFVKPDITTSVQITPSVSERSEKSSAREEKKSTVKQISIEEKINQDETLDSIQKKIQLKILDKLNSKTFKTKVVKIQDYEKYQIVKMVYNMMFYGLSYGADGIASIAKDLYVQLKTVK